MSAAAGDEQVAQWTRMLEAGTLTEPGYLAMVTAYAKAAFDRQHGAVEALPVVAGEQVVAVAAAEAPQQLNGRWSKLDEPAEVETASSSSSLEEDDAEWRPGRQGSKKGTVAGLGAAKMCVAIPPAAAATP